MNVVALLLAAGSSERMGRSKALLPWHGQPLVSHQLQQIQRTRVAECVVVLGRDADAIEPLVERAFRPGWKSRAVRNLGGEDGKSGSIRSGLTALASRPDGILIAAVDQPLDFRLLRTLLEEAEAEWEAGGSRRSVVVPTFEGRRGHPPLFRGTLFSELMGISEEHEGLKAVVRRDPARVFQVAWHDPGILVNLNAPVDLPSPALRDTRLR